VHVTVLFTDKSVRAEHTPGVFQPI
jgi:hypothetical protein